jgi:hypothetical protein
MSKRLIGVVAAAGCAAGFVVPSSASAVTRATGVGVYAASPQGGWVYDCNAVPIGPYIARVERCYMDESTGSPRLCAQASARDLNVLFPSSWLGQVTCSDPNAPGAATAGYVRFAA